MAFKPRALVLGLALTALGSNAFAGNARPVVVELFTSQGCSDCPAADKVLSELAERRDVIALSLPITYWDMLGWKDSFASEANTERQRAYSKALRIARVYTPQIVVDGTQNVVGNQRDKVLAAIAAQQEASSRVRPVPINVTRTRGRLEFSIRANSAFNNADASVWMMRTISRGRVHVTGGENKDHDLVFANVVRDLQRIGPWNGRALSFDVKFDAGDASDGVAVILQKHGAGQILGATLIRRNELSMVRSSH